MNPNLENPFRDPTKRAKKRLFKDARPARIFAVKEKLDKLETSLVQYGPHKILYPQVQYLKQLEKLIPAERPRDWNLNSVKELLAHRIEVDSKGNIVNLNLLVLDIKIIPNLRKLNELLVLNVGQNPLKEIPGLGYLTKLVKLDCAGCELTNLAGLEKLQNLISLRCGFNKELTDLPGLFELPKLQEIMAKQCNFSHRFGHQIKDLFPWAKL